MTSPRQESCTWLLVPEDGDFEQSWKTWCGQWHGIVHGFTPEPDGDSPNGVFICGFHFCPCCGGRLTFVVPEDAE